ncbi:MAG TPA: O-antigen ligase family protein [Candidatus Methylacidiphilales bacterium]|nr:O-antigen ligase family protein [Candidatus Methylacidiphilales bacterium]
MPLSSRASSSSNFQFGKELSNKLPESWDGVGTAWLTGLILLAAPLVLGAARLWYELPLLVAVAVLLTMQGIRLCQAPARKEQRRMDAIDWAVILFVIYAAVRWLTSPTEYFSRLEALNVFGYAVIFLTCRRGLARRAHGLIMLAGLVFLGVFETGFGYFLSRHSDIYQPQNLWFPFGPTERLQLHYMPRWIGTYGCPDHYVELLVMALGAAFAFGAFSKLPWPLRIVFFYLGAVMLAGIMYSLSRGGWLGLFACIIALMVFGLRHGAVRWWMPVLASFLLLAAIAGFFTCSPLVRSRVLDFANTFEDNNSFYTYVRVELARDALRIAADHPYFGTGPATFVFIHPRYQSATFSRKAVLTHDDYLNCLDDYGLVGFGIAMFFVSAVTLKFLTGKLVDGRWQDRVITVSGFAAWSALLVHSTVDFNLHIPANAMLLFALTGMGLSRFREIEHWSTVSLDRFGRLPGYLVILLGLAYGTETLRTAVSDIIYEKTIDRALDEEQNGTIPTAQAIEDGKLALKWDWGNAQAMMMLGDLYRYRASREKEMEGRMIEGQEALAAYQRALAANPLDDTILARMGMTFDVIHRYPEAFFCYEQAVTAERYNGQFWNQLGNHFWQRGMLEKAEQAYLLAAACPNGFEGSQAAADEVQQLLNAHGISPPLPGTNPLESEPEKENAEPPTVP